MTASRSASRTLRCLLEASRPSSRTSASARRGPGRTHLTSHVLDAPTAFGSPLPARREARASRGALTPFGVPAGMLRCHVESLAGPRTLARPGPGATCPLRRTHLYVRATSANRPISAHRLAVQDVALSRQKHGFESRWARQAFQGLISKLRPISRRCGKNVGSKHLDSGGQTQARFLREIGLDCRARVPATT